MQVIIFKNNEGGVSVIYPTQECLGSHTIDKIAQKDVPSGKPYKIVDVSELPSRELRNQWDIDEADLTDGVGAESNEFASEVEVKSSGIHKIILEKQREAENEPN